MNGNKKLIYAALFAALCCVITMYPKFPTLFGYIHAGDALVLLAAYVRLVSQRPGLNRFVMGQKIYARRCFEAMLCVKKEMKLNSPDSVISMVFPLDSTADEIYETAEKLIEEAKSETTNFDDTARILDYIPGLLKKFAFWLLRVLDYS